MKYPHDITIVAANFIATSSFDSCGNEANNIIGPECSDPIINRNETLSCIYVQQEGYQ